MKLDSVVYFLVSLCCSLPCAALAVYFGVFMWNGIELPIGIDSSASWHTPPHITSSKLTHNTLLLLIFPIQHTLTLRGPLGSLLKWLVPEQYRRPLYSLSAGLALGLTMYLWQPMPQAIWSIPHNSPATTLLYFVSALGFVLTILSINTMDPLGLDMIGLKGSLAKLLEWQQESREVSLVESGFYGLVRHPAYTGVMIALWTTPTMSVGRLLWCFSYTVYMIVAVRYSEEPALVREIGTSYKRYMDITPPFFPRLTRHTKNS